MSDPRKSPYEIATIIQTLRSIHLATPRDAMFLAHLDRLLMRDDAAYGKYWP